MANKLTFNLKGLKLNIDDTVVRRVNSLVVRSGLHRKTMPDVHGALETLVINGLVNKEDLDSLFKQLIPGSSGPNAQQGVGMSQSSRAWLSSCVFEALDTTGNGIVDVGDIMCGMSALLEGSKSAKLAFLFDVLDEDEDGLLSKRQLWKYFRSMLSTLLLLTTDNALAGTHGGAAANGGGKVMSREELRRTLEEVAVWTAASVLQHVKQGREQAAAGQQQRGVSFQDISDWYSSSGYAIASWIELLDLQKWLPLSRDEDSESEQQATRGQFQARHSSTDTQNAPILYQSQLCGDEDGQGPSGMSPRHLVLTQVDADYVRRICTSTGFYAVECGLLVKALQYFAVSIRHAPRSSNGTMSSQPSEFQPCVAYPMFIDFIQGLLPTTGGGAASAENGKLAATLSYVFSLFEEEEQVRSGAGGDSDLVKVAHFPALACGLSLLCSGSKSNKLSLGFSLFDTDGDGFLSVKELASFVAAYLTVLLGFSNHAVRNRYAVHFPALFRNGDGSSENWLCDVCQELALLIVAQCEEASFNRHAQRHPDREDDSSVDSEDDGVRIMDGNIYVNFEAFGGWYNGGGYRFMSWIELIDLYKWIERLPHPDKAGGADDDEDEDEGDSDKAEYEHALSYVWKTQQAVMASPPKQQASTFGKLSPKEGSHVADYDEVLSMDTGAEDTEADTQATDEFDRLARQRVRGLSVDDDETDASTGNNDVVMEHFPRHQRRRAFSEELEGEGEGEQPERDVTAFTLNMSSADYDCVFPVSQMIVTNVCLFSTRLGFSSLSPAVVGRVILQHADPTTHLISKRRYEMAVNELLDASGTSLYYGDRKSATAAGSAQKLSGRIFCEGYNVILDSLFFAYTRDAGSDGDATSRSIAGTVASRVKTAARSGGNYAASVDAVDLACGMMILCQGSKSDKLLLAFDIIANQYRTTLVALTSKSTVTPTLALGETSNSLSRYETFRFFRNFAVALFTLCGCYLQLDDSGVGGSVRVQEKLMDSVAMHITDSVVAAVQAKQRAAAGPGATRNNHVRINFDDIAEWYSGDGMSASSGHRAQSGHDIMNWLELLDVGKWVKLVSAKHGEQ